MLQHGTPRRDFTSGEPSDGAAFKSEYKCVTRSRVRVSLCVHLSPTVESRHHTYWGRHQLVRQYESKMLAQKKTKLEDK